MSGQTPDTWPGAVISCIMIKIGQFYINNRDLLFMMIQGRLIRMNTNTAV